MGKTESVNKTDTMRDDTIPCEALAAVYPMTGEQAFKRFYRWYRDMREGSEKEFRESAEPIIEQLLTATNGFKDLKTELYMNNPGLMWPTRLAYFGMGSGRLGRNRFVGHVITEADSDPNDHSRYDYMVNRMETNNKMPEYDNAEAMLVDFLNAHEDNQGIDTETVRCNPDAFQELKQAMEKREQLNNKLASLREEIDQTEEQIDKIMQKDIDDSQKIEELQEAKNKLSKLRDKRQELEEKRKKVTAEIDELQDEKAHLKEVKRMLMEHMVDEKMNTKMRMSGDRHQEDELTAMLDDDYDYEQLDNTEVDSLKDGDFGPGHYLVHKKIELAENNHNIDYIINPRNYHKPLFIEAKKAGRPRTADDQCEKIKKVHHRLREQHSGNFLYVANLMGFFGQEHVEALREDGIDVFYEHDKERSLDPVLQLMACLVVSGML